MGTLATIGINNNLTACKTSVTMWPANNELACRVNEILDTVIEQGQNLLAYLLLHPWHQYFYYVLAYLCQHGVIVVVAVGILDEVVVLCTYNNGVYTLRHTIVAILYRYLAL